MIKMIDISERTKMLKSLFSFEKKNTIEDTKVEILPFHFSERLGSESTDSLQIGMPSTEFCSDNETKIKENREFDFVIFKPACKNSSGTEESNAEEFKECILLLHGLNERSWEKYLTWAEDLAINCNRPVILFPMAFHMNRTPASWCAPRIMMPWSSKRRVLFGGIKNSTFCNVALSSRLSICPQRFYVSGRESVYNIAQLARDIRDGKILNCGKKIFSQDCRIDFFAYSVGALLAQTVLISNPDSNFSASKLCTFCGGSIFKDMDGSSKDIVDSEAFEKIHNYYCTEFIKTCGDFIHDAYKSLITPECLKQERESFFTQARDRIKMLTLKKDRVIPTIGALHAVGINNTGLVEEMDFPFDYSHQIPFPAPHSASLRMKELLPNTVYSSFRRVFDAAEKFLK
jgi:hypothetical protein